MIFSAIAKRDFVAFFSTPKGPLVFGFVLGVAGITFLGLVSQFLTMQQILSGTKSEMPSFDSALNSFFDVIKYTSTLLVPVITMGSFAEETRSQSIRFLQVSPIAAFEVALGKFAAAASIATMAVLGTAVYPAFVVAFGDPDIGLILTTYLGLLIMIWSQVAFGVWISSIASNQFTALLITLFGTLFFSLQSYLSPSQSGTMIEEFLAYLASSTHLTSFFRGMLVMSDVAYFACGTAGFLLFATMSFDSQRLR